MDDDYSDFEREYPGFNWREIPPHKHPGGMKKCPCPKHEHLRDKMRTHAIVSKNSKELVSFEIKLCPDHYNIYFEIINELSWWRKGIVKFFIKYEVLKIIKVKYMESETCYYCRFGTGRSGDRKKVYPTL